jgi:hypothetical protein
MQMGGPQGFAPVPTEFICPIGGKMMIEPMIAGDGFTYERVNIEQWLTTTNRSPKTGVDLPHPGLSANYFLKSEIDYWKVINPHHPLSR